MQVVIVQNSCLRYSHILTLLIAAQKHTHTLVVALFYCSCGPSSSLPPSGGQQKHLFGANLTLMSVNVASFQLRLCHCSVLPRVMSSVT